MKSLLLLCCLLSPSVVVSAQAPAAATAPRYLKVSAPMAQKLLVAAKAAHPEIKKIGLHSVPPGETESCIIANPIESKIGKVSSAADLTAVTTNEAKIYPHEEEGGFFDMAFPMADAQGRPIGLMVMELPYRAAPTREAALAMGTRFRDEIASQIPDKAALFSPAR